MAAKEEIRTIFEELFVEMFKKHEEPMIKYLAGSTTLLREEIKKINNRFDDIERKMKGTDKGYRRFKN